MDSRMCSAQKCTFLQRGAHNRRHARALTLSFERPPSPTWTSPQLTTSAFLESSSLRHVLCECHNKAGVFTNVDMHTSVPRTRSSFSAFAFSVTHIVKKKKSHWKGSYDYTADSFSKSPMLSATRSPKKLRKARRTKHENKESISI